MWGVDSLACRKRQSVGYLPTSLGGGRRRSLGSFENGARSGRHVRGVPQDSGYGEVSLEKRDGHSED